VLAEADAGETDAELSPVYRILAAPAIRALALRLAIPLFVGRPDAGMARPAAYPSFGVDR
jgi:hypothetical protein